MELQAELNRLAGTDGLEAQGAANAWAGTSGLELLGALNSRNGTSGLGLNAVCNSLAGTDGMEAQAALGLIPDLNPLLAEALLMLLASEFTGDPGDDWVNLGSAGSALNAVADGAPVWEDGGFTFADGSSGTQGSASPYYYVPHSALLDPGTESYTAFARVHWVAPEPSGGEPSNVMSKVSADLPIGAGGTGWQIIDSEFFTGPGAVISAGDTNFGVDPAVSMAAAHLAEDTDYLLVVRLDRGEEEITIFVNGTPATAGPSDGVVTVTAVHELIFGRGTEQIGRAYGYWDRALTDNEITVDLPAALGIE